MELYNFPANEPKVKRLFLRGSYLLSEPFLRQVIACQDRTGIPKINRDQLNAVIVAKPPLDEQKDIAKTLTACNQKIDALEAEVLLYDELFRVLLEELMVGRISTLSLVDRVSANA
jgi:restriction endonuclease S subunit